MVPKGLQLIAHFTFMEHIYKKSNFRNTLHHFCTLLLLPRALMLYRNLSNAEKICTKKRMCYMYNKE